FDPITYHVCLPRIHTPASCPSLPYTTLFRSAIRTYWSDDDLERSTIAKGAFTESALNTIVAEHPDKGLSAKGRGLFRGLEFENPDHAAATCRNAFGAGLLVETSGPRDEVIKLLPPLTLTNDELAHGLDLLRQATADAVA